MAVLYLGINVGGQDFSDVTVDSSTTSSDIELAIDDTNLTAGAISKKQFVTIALEAIAQALEETDV